ncbi:MAG: DinB family protein [Chitinophagales bacterium]
MSNSIKHLINQFNLQTRLFNNVTSNITDADAGKSMNENTNHIAWITGHIVSTRYMLANALGQNVQEPFPTFFENGKGMDKTATYPSMQDLTKDWGFISEKVTTALAGLTDEATDTKMPQPVPTGDTLGDFIAFLAHHEAYTIGQLGIYRRFHGLDSMKYN